MAVLILDSPLSVQPTLEMADQISRANLLPPVLEFEFHSERRWRFDFSWPAVKLALEIEGGIFARKGSHKCRYCGQTPRGRHASGKGMLEDMMKYNAATLLGWRLLRVTPQMVSSGEALSLIEKALK